MTDQLTERKKEMRRTKVALRKAQSAEEQEQRSARICRRLLSLPAYQKAKVLLLYHAMPGEVSLEEFRRKAIQDKKVVCYPRCVDKTHMIALVPEGEDAYLSGPFGIREPDPKRSVEVRPEEIDLVVAACSAFDSRCNRLGMGAGYYDRYLPECKQAFVAVAAYELQKVDRVPVNEFDQRPDIVVTEEQIYIWNEERTAEKTETVVKTKGNQADEKRDRVAQPLRD